VPKFFDAASLPRLNHHEWAMVYVGQLEGFLSRIACNASEGTHCTKSEVHKPIVNESMISPKKVAFDEYDSFKT